MTQLQFDARNTNLQELGARIRKGNNILWQRWDAIKQMEEGDKRDKYLTKWDEAKDRLIGLCAELEQLGEGCVYSPVEPPQRVCLACPAKPWRKEECQAFYLEI